jgi:hypothetical protein
MMAEITRLDYLTGCALTGLLHPEYDLSYKEIVKKAQEIGEAAADTLNWQDEAASDTYNCSRCGQEYPACPECGQPYPVDEDQGAGDDTN